jgi:hypothetical protein
MDEVSQRPPVEQLAVAAGIVNDAEQHLPALRGERALLAWSLTCFERVSGLQRAGYWQPDTFFRERALALGVAADVLTVRRGSAPSGRSAGHPAGQEHAKRQLGN